MSRKRCHATTDLLQLAQPDVPPRNLKRFFALADPVNLQANEAFGVCFEDRFVSQILDRLGMAQYLAGECATAVATYEKALALLPNAHGLLNNFAYLCIDCLKDPAKALPAARKAVQLQPTRPEYLDTLGEALAALGELAEALNYLDRAAGLADSASIELHRAGVLERQGKKGEALSAIEKGLALSPDPKTRAALGELQSRLK